MRSVFKAIVLLVVVLDVSALLTRVHRVVLTRQSARAVQAPVPIGVYTIESARGEREREKARRQESSPASLNRVGTTLFRCAWTEASWGSRGILMVAIIALLASKGLTVTVPFFLQRGVDALVAQNVGAACVGIVWYCLGRCLVTTTSEIRALCYAFASQQATRRYAQRLFKAMHELGSDFHAKNPTGLLSTAFSRGARGFQTLLGQLLFSIFPTCVELTLSAAVLTEKFGTEVGLIALTTFTLYACYTAFIVQLKVRVRRRLVELDNAKTAYLVDSLACHEQVKMLDAVEAETSRFDQFLTRLVTALVASSRVGSILNLGQALIFSVGLCLALLKVAASPTSSVGDVVAVNALLLQCAMPMNFLGYTVTEIRQSLVDMTITQNILHEHKQAVDNRIEPKALPDDLNPNTAPSLVFKHVSKHYDTLSTSNSTHTTFLEHEEEKKRFVALETCDFVAEAGKVTVLCGQSGSGKSTALRLAARLDTPSSGSVVLDYGKHQFDVAELPSELRARSALVPQEALLFDETAWLNVKYSDLNASDDEVWKALAAANVDVTQLPDGVNTRVGERGQQISGGQRQRLAIARALLRRPTICLADEATSGLDAVTERDVLKSLVGSVHTPRTLLVVAHRLAAVAPHADKIVVFKNGTIVQVGSHSDLLQDTDGEYFRLWYAAVGESSEKNESNDAVLPRKKKASSSEEEEIAVVL